MAGGKLPPRQKMIGLMYLVLLALLAMNVSKSILESFVIINDGIENTTKTFDASNAILYNSFDRAASESPAAKTWADKASKVKKSSNEIYDHIEKIKVAMYKVIDQLPEGVADTIPLASINSKDNFDEPTRLMGIAEPSKPGSVPDCEECSSTLLKEKLNSYHKLLLDVFEDKDIKDEIEKKIIFLETHEVHNHDGAKDPWEVGMFYHNPLAAVITTLSKIQSDIRTAEAQVISRLYENIDAGGVSFNKVDGFAYTKKAYVMDGDTFKAEIFTAAYDDRVEPEIFIGKVDSSLILKGETDENKIMQGAKKDSWEATAAGTDGWYKLEDIKGGKGYLAVKQGMGVHEWGGIIKVKTKKGPKVFPFSNTFEVGKPSTTVAASAMNVFYMGIDNPVSVSAPMPNFKASGPGLRPGKGQGQYVMKPTKVGNVTINVTGTDESGKTVNLGKSEFRVKRIPNPVPYIAGKTGTCVMSKGDLGRGVIQAKMEGFEFDIKVAVKSFVLGTTVNGDYKEAPCSGNRLDSKAQALVQRASRGQRFYLEKMKVTLPDGRTVELANINIKII
ncbi:MAG: gliding motility protein GldM [Flavobacteriales bacterium]|nr:gliding motility protein GldM [Flavobacteriales bacterium]MCB9363686.1 gliding motility protein GldM [Flavobacteriales bacterium]